MKSPAQLEPVPVRSTRTPDFEGRWISGVLTRLSSLPRWTLVFSSAVLSAAVAFLDRATGLETSLGAFYILPVILSAVTLTRWQVVMVAAGNALLREKFMLAPTSWFDAVTRFLLAFAAYLAAAFFVVELNRNRQLAHDHAEELKERDRLRREAEDHLRILAESSPAAILTLDEHARILSCNQSARDLFGGAEGDSIAEILPVLADALKMENVDPFHTAAQCQGRRRDGEPFLAHTWFSTYRTASGKRLAAIAVDSSEEAREHEEQSLRQLLANNRIIAGAVYHEIRNMCGAISLVYADLLRKSSGASSDDFIALGHLVEGLGKIASTELQTKVKQPLRPLQLGEVLNHLRIIIEPGWREAGGLIEWMIPPALPQVYADAFGLTQAFLNITQNSLRAARRNEDVHMVVKVEVRSADVLVSFEDSGPGIADIARLFQPFQSRSDHVGLGLYISRAIVRGYGGELKAQPRSSGACFEMSLTRADGAASIAV